jgi:hydroxymethylbilane synthase
MSTRENPKKRLIIGSRGSQLALWQARHVAGLLGERGFETRIEIIRTTGDRLSTADLTRAVGKGLFTKEIEEALFAGSIDLAVHSLKDLPAELPDGMALAAIPAREDPRDAMVGARLNDLPHGARVGTSSERRRAQLAALRPDLCIEPVRGNVDTRVRKVKEGHYSAVVLALAGLRRLGLEAEASQIFSPREICPAAGQGALAIETKAQDADWPLWSEICDPAARDAVSCEREILSKLGGGCHLPLGVFAQIERGALKVCAVAISPDGRRLVRSSGSGPRCEPEALARSVVSALLAKGAGELLNVSR